ncbi:MAG TPA: MFS transporter [Gammaproteobacteria bacterium]|nr:MFS transporter [Gammaproteobacteria bacterium]
MSDDAALRPAERRAGLLLAGLMSLRMLGLFLVLPVLAAYANGLPGATPTLVGLAVGSYGLTQALLQVPFGWLSDRYGRQRLIVLGLMLFAGGSLIAAGAGDIGWLIVGRMLQGAGAVAAVITALLSDLTRPSQRTKVMALLGISIGAAFIAAMMLGPLLAAHVGVRGLFLLGAALGLVGLPLLLLLPRGPTTMASGPAELLAALRQPALLRLDLGIFLLHATLTSTFVVLPLSLQDGLNLPLASHWRLYVPVMLVSVLSMLPIIMRHGGREERRLFPLATGILVLSQLLLPISTFDLLGVGVTLWLFFTGFNLLEAALPAAISRAAPEAGRGAAMGAYSTAQFLGAFAGGMLGGTLLGSVGSWGVFSVNALALALWLGLSRQIPPASRTAPTGHDG